MAYDPIPKKIGDINLDNYYLDQQLYNTSVYIHKKFLPKSHRQKISHCDVGTNYSIVKENTQEKNQQYNIETHIENAPNGRKKGKSDLYDDPVIAQTVKFAKDLVPKIIPPSREFSPTPVFYTIKASKKSGKKVSKLSSPLTEYNCKLDIEKSKNVAKNSKKDKIELRSPVEDGSHSSQDNTSDDSQTNQSSSFSLTEVFETSLNKTTEKQRKRKYDSKPKLAISDSLEGIATVIDGSNNQIKIQIMNETEKNIFYENLRVPIVNSVKEYLNEIRNPLEISADLQILSQTLSSNTQKLEYVMHTLDKIEKKIMNCCDKKTKIIMSPKPISSRESRLEELAEDLPELKEINSADEEQYEANIYKQAIASRNAVVSTSQIHDYKPNRITENRKNGDNEPIHMNSTYSVLGVKQDRPNKIPTRFCWTDTDRKI